MSVYRTHEVCMVAYTNYAFDTRVRREAETLAANGFRVRCLSTQNGSTPARFVLNGVEVRELAVPKYRGKSAAAYVGSYVRFLTAASTACLRLLGRRQLDVLHVHNVPDFLALAGVLPRLSGCKVVLDVHDSVPETFATKFAASPMLERVLLLEERLSAMAAHCVICVNHPQRDVLVARGIPASKTFVSMNVPDPRIFGGPAAPSAGELSDGRFNLVYHGTMAERLGVDLVIRAVARLRKQIPYIRLHLWGQGDDLAAFQDLVRELSAGDHVHFVPTGVPLEQLPGALRRMDVGIVGNRRSAASELMLPVKLMEYVGLGIPAIVPRLGAIAHYFSDDMVAYFEPDDVESLADRIRAAYAAPARRRRQAARAKQVLKQYGWERQGPELVALYHTLLEH